MSSPPREATPAHYRWNFTVLSLDIAFYYLSTTLVSFSTILPAYLRHFTDSNLVIGALAAIVAGGYSLPNLLFAPITERVARKKKFILFVTPGERLPYLALAAIAGLLAVPHPALAVAVSLAVLVVFTFTGGALTPAWLDLIARAIPARRRGAFFGRSNALAGLMGIGGAVISQHLLDLYGFPNGYVRVFLLAFAVVVVSYGFFALNREQGPFRVATPEPAWRWFLGLPRLLRSDRNFSWYLLSAMAASLATAAGGFFAVVAIARLGTTDQDAGWFTAVLLAAQTIFNLVWAWLADRHGHKIVLLAGQTALLLAIPLSLVIPTAASYALVFVLFGAANSASSLSRLAIMLEFAPEDARPTYVGLASVAAAPLAFAGPLFGGWLADRHGYTPPFALFWLAGALAFYLLACRVREPRHGS